MSTEKTEHPSKMSATDLDALRKSDPSAFDDDDDSTGEILTGESIEEKPEVKAVVKEEVIEPIAEKKAERSPNIPKERFDEVIVQRNETAEKLSATEQQLAEARRLLEEAKAPKQAVVDRDFDTEYQSLSDKYDEGDLTHAEYLKATRALQKEEVSLTVDARVKALDEERSVKAIETDWKTANAQWTAENKDFVSLPGARTAMQSAIEYLDKEHADKPLGSVELLEKAHIIAARMIDVALPKIEATPTEKPVSARQVENASQAAKASNTPPSLNTGRGQGNGPDTNIDLKALKPGQFSKLSKEQQEKLLGADAL